MKIKIRNRTSYEKLILGIFIAIFGEGVLNVFIPQIHLIYYLTDVINIVLLICLISRMGKKQGNSYLRFFYFILFLYVILTAMGAIVNFSNIALHLWSFRSYFTTILFFVVCVSFEHSDKIDFLDKLVWINFIVCVIEVALGYRQDWIGGVYGVSGGQVNGPLNLLLIIIFSRSVVQYINKEISIRRFLTLGASSLIIAIFAELKIFFVEIVIIFVIASLVTKFSVRKLAIVIFGAVGIFVAIRATLSIFPEMNRNMFKLSFMWRYLTNSGGYVGQFAHDAGDVNRLSFWNKCVALFHNKFELLFGFGIGNCDQIQVLGLQSYIYMRYEAMHYYMFPLPMILLQQGIIGMILYIMLLVSLFIAVLKKYRLKDYISKSQIQMTLILCVMAFVITIYDTSLLGKGGFLFFYILALPFINTATQRKGWRRNYDS